MSDAPTWGIETIPGGVKIWHVPCGQYMSVHQGRWVGLIMEVMNGHVCPKRSASE